MTQNTLILTIALCGGVIYMLVCLRINIISLFKTPKIILGKGKNSYHAIHGGWGDHIEFFDNDTSSTIRKIWGHSEDNIQNGHILRSHGDTEAQIKLWVISNFERKRDPRDMFFADVKFLGLSTDTYNIDKEQ
jgi:hypothetical protein